MTPTTHNQDSDDAAEAQAALVAKKKKSAEIDQQTLQAAKKKAEVMQKEQTLTKGVPKSATALEADLKSLKSDKASLIKHLACSISETFLTLLQKLFSKEQRFLLKCSLLSLSL